MSLSLKNKTNIAFVAALITLAIVGWFSIQESRRTDEKDHLVSHGRDVIEASEQLRSHIYDASVARRAYTLWGDAAQIDAFNLSSKGALADLATLYKLTADNSQQQIALAQMEPLIKARLSLLKESVEFHETHRSDLNQQEVFNDRSTKLATEVTDQVDKFARTERGLLQERLAAVQASNQRATTINIFLGICIFLFLMFTLGLLNRELYHREQAERSAAEQKELLQSILDSCSDAVIVANTAGKIILRNPVGVRYNAGAPADELSESYPELLGLFKADRKTLFKTEELPLSRALKGTSEVGLEICVRSTQDAEPRWMLADGGPLLNVRGEHRGGVVFLRDITDRKKADEQLKLALLESEALAKERIELSEFGDSMQACLSIDEIFRMCERTIPGILDSRSGTLSVINPSRDLVETVASWENCTTAEPVFHPDDCWALRRGKTHGPNSPLPCAHVNKSVGTDYLCVPLIDHGETLGVMYLENNAKFQTDSPQAMKFGQSTINRRANAVAERISFALANLKLRELLRNQSIRDPLTGLFNRRYLEESLNRELNRASRTGRNVSLAMLDLDHFKHFNDTFGHQVGDILLREVAGVIKSRVRAGDLACRYGGEEFSLILAEVDAEGTYKCVESIREAIKNLSLHHRGQTLGTITVSAGIATFPAHANSTEDLIRYADESLYRAKKAGRDRIMVYEASESQSITETRTI